MIGENFSSKGEKASWRKAPSNRGSSSGLAEGGKNFKEGSKNIKT